MSLTTRFTRILVPLLITLVLAASLPTKAVTQEEIVWQPTNGPDGGTINALAVTSSGDIFAATNGSGVFRSMDHGRTWTLINAGLTGATVNAFLLNASGSLLAGTSRGVFRLVETENTWTPTGLTTVSVRALAVTSSEHLLAGSEGSGGLTVWRKLYVEVDSMEPIPAHPDPETNVVKGNVASIDGDGTRATKVFVTTSPPHQNLGDGSAMLPNANGRFENGTITIGSSSGARATGSLRGNGIDFVEKTASAGIIIPFTISKSGVSGTVAGSVWRLDPATRTFSLRVTSGTLTTAYVGGQIEVTGVGMTIQTVNPTARTVTVQQLVNIPFGLVDDDATTHPFNVNTSLMQDSDSSSANLFAPAYIKPVYDLGTGGKQPGFNLNVMTEFGVNPLQSEVETQLSRGRDRVSTNDYWVAYIQGAFQGDATLDVDPDEGERVLQGNTPTIPNNPPSDLQQGSLIFVETIRDFKNTLTTLGLCLNANLLAQTTVHEVGHQFGLDDGAGGIMGQIPVQNCIPVADQKFLPEHLNAIRGRTHP